MWEEHFAYVVCAYQFKKASFHGHSIATRKLQTARASVQARYMSKFIRETPELQQSWNLQRRKIMYATVAVQFRDDGLRKRLLHTGECRLVENVASREGNGVILMDLRFFIRNTQHQR